MAMTRDELDRVFDLVGFSTTDKDLIKIFLDFAGVIAEEEREFIAEMVSNCDSRATLKGIAAAIRARGQ